MSKANLSPGDFTIAGKIGNSQDIAKIAGAEQDQLPPPDVADVETIDETAGKAEGDTTMLRKRSAAEREKRARDRAIAQEDARASLKNLKRAKQREVKFYVNVALDQATKTRLKTAADENDLKMATVMKAAIDFYLKENGY